MHLTWLIKWNTLEGSIKVHMYLYTLQKFWCHLGILAYLAKSTGHHEIDRNLDLFPTTNLFALEFRTKIQQTKMLVTCQRFGDLFLFGLVWQYSLIQKNIVKVGSKSLLLTYSSNKIWAYLYYIFLIRRES